MELRLNIVSLLITVFSISAAAGWAALPIVENPHEDYVKVFQCEDTDDLIVTEIDLNNDGIDDIFVTQRGLYNGRQGNIWVLYRSVGGSKFERLDELTGGGVIEFHPKATSFQDRPNGSGRDLIRYSPSGAGKGHVMTYQLGPSGMGETIGREIVPGGSDESYFIKTFENPKTTLVYKLRNVGDVRAGIDNAIDLFPDDGAESGGGLNALKVILMMIGAVVVLFFLYVTLRYGPEIIRIFRGRPRIS